MIIKASVVLTLVCTPVFASAGGIITHGREPAEPEHGAGEPTTGACDRYCQQLDSLKSWLYESRDAHVSRAADAAGFELTVDMLERPGDFGLEPHGEGGCSGAPPTLFSALVAAWALIRRRRG